SRTGRPGTAPSPPAPRGTVARWPHGRGRPCRAPYQPRGSAPGGPCRRLRLRVRPLSGCFDRYDHRLGAVGVARRLNEVRVGNWRRHLTPYSSCDTTQIGQRGVIAAVSAALLLALLAAAPGGAARPYNVPDLRPWRPSLAVRFT